MGWAGKNTTETEKLQGFEGQKKPRAPQVTKISVTASLNPLTGSTNPRIEQSRFILSDLFALEKAGPSKSFL